MSSVAMAVDVAIAKDTTATALSLFLGHLRAELTRHYVAKANILPQRNAQRDRRDQGL